MEKKKIIFFLGSMRRGGAERVISILSQEYALKGWDTSIGVLLFYEQGYALDESIKFLNFTGGNGSRVGRIPYWIHAIRQYVKKENPDVIVSFAARINAVVQLACTGLHKKIVISERSDPRCDGREGIIKLLNNIFYPKAHKVIFQTRRAQVYFNSRIQKNSKIILNPIIVRQKASTDKKRKIVNVGKCFPQKNQKMLIKAFAEVSARHPEYELWIYGDGYLKEELKELCIVLNISDKVRFAGNVSDIHREIADAELFVLSSDYEGLSNALMEAMMMGLACISTDCAGADEIITDGENGLLVSVGDQEGLSKAMDKLIENKELAKYIGINAEKDSKRFEAISVLKQWDEVITS